MLTNDAISHFLDLVPKPPESRPESVAQVFSSRIKLPIATVYGPHVSKCWEPGAIAKSIIDERTSGEINIFRSRSRSPFVKFHGMYK